MADCRRISTSPNSKLWPFLHPPRRRNHHHQARKQAAEPLQVISEGRDEDDRCAVCPGCGVFLQDADPDLPGFFTSPPQDELGEEEPDSSDGFVGDDEEDDDLPSESDLAAELDGLDTGFLESLQEEDEDEEEGEEDSDKIDMDAESGWHFCSDAFLTVNVLQLQAKQWKRMVPKATFVGPGFTRKPPKCESFIRLTGLRFTKAHVTHPELKCTFNLNIISVKKNPNGPMYTSLGVMTRGTIIEVNASELGLANRN